MSRLSLTGRSRWLRLAALAAAVSSSWLVSPVEALVYNPVEANCYSSLGDWKSYGSSQQQTPGLCGGTCQDAGFTLFAVSGTQCWCGNAMPSSDAISTDDSCNTACAYFTSQKCGAAGVFVVYSAGGDIPASTQAGSSSSTDTPSSSADASTAPLSSGGSATTAAVTTSQATTGDSSSSPSSSSSLSSSQTTSSAATTQATTAATTTGTSPTSAATTSPTSGQTTTSPPSRTTSSASKSSTTATSSGAGGLDDGSKHKKGGSGISGGAIAGIVVGVVGGLAVIAALAFLFFLRNRRRERDDDDYYSPHSTPDKFKGGEGPNKTGFSGPYPDYTGQKYPPPPPLGSSVSVPSQGHDWGALANPVLDQRLNPELLGDPRISIASLADARDYSRQILKVANPDEKP